MTKVKKGDLVEWMAVPSNDFSKFETNIGIVLSLSKSGRNSLMANVLFDDGRIEWTNTSFLSVISSRNQE